MSALSRPAISSISATTTEAPSSAKRLTVARPIPLPPPVTIAILPASRPLTASPGHHRAGDRDLLELVSARVDALDARSSPHSGDRVLVHETGAAEQLDALVEHTPLHLRCPELEDRAVLESKVAGAQLDHRGIDEGLGDLDVGLALGD